MPLSGLDVDVVAAGADDDVRSPGSESLVGSKRVPAVVPPLDPGVRLAAVTSPTSGRGRGWK